MISKELLSEVLGKDVSDVSIVMNNINYVIKNHETQEDEELVYIDLGMNVNIYELASKCKEWLFDNGADYTIWRTHKHRFYSEKYYLDIEADTEIEAIFKACEWILKEINK